MSISGIGAATTTHVATSTLVQDKATVADRESSIVSEGPPSTIVTLDNNTTSIISSSSSALSSMPMSNATAPNLFAQADLDHDNLSASSSLPTSSS